MHTLQVVMDKDPLTVEVLPGSSAGSRIVRMTGPLTLQNFFSMQAELAKDHPRLTILDLSAVPYVDSAGMGAIINAYVSAERRGHKVVVAGANFRVLELFKLTKVDALIQMTETVEQAGAF